MDQLTIKSSVKHFKVKFVHNFSFVDEILQIPHYLVVVGSNVYEIYKEKIFDTFPKEKLLVLKLDEQRKSLVSVTKIYKKLLEQSAKRNIILISFGGGVNQDISGFVASTIYRGIDWIFIPTTLLAMCDSSIGLKTSLNFQSYKNVLGNFYPPDKIYINVDFLKTLKKKDFYGGVGEIIKFYLMDKNPIKSLAQTINKIKKLNERDDNAFITKVIRESFRIKLSYMLGDEFDHGIRNLLNYGHELGHALEATSHFKVPHGVGVIIGIIFANLVSYNKGWIDKNTFEKINRELLLPNLPTDAIKLKTDYFEINQIIEKMKKDKKRISDKLPLVLPKGANFQIVKISDFDLNECKNRLKELITIIKSKLD